MSERKPKRPINPDFIVDPKSVPYSEPTFRGFLPHMQKPGCTYFVTFCLADVAPGRAEDRKRMIEGDSPFEIAKSADPDVSRGSCLLRDERLAAIVEDSLLHFQGVRYLLSAWCVMPNHVHVVITPLGEHGLPKILQSWKGFCARRINRILNRSGSVWQKESFDHIVRSPESFEAFVAYVERNPVAAGLVAEPEGWRFSSASHRRPL